MRAALYARCSTGSQDLGAQVDALTEYARRRGAEPVVFADKGVSGRKDRRPALDAMMDAARRREIDVIVVARIDRLARSLAHMARLGDELRDLGVGLVSLAEAVDTTTSTGRAMLGMCGVFAQLEADIIRERTLAGLARSRKLGRRPGPRPTLIGVKLARARRLRRAGRSLRHIARVLGTSRASVHRATRDVARRSA